MGSELSPLVQARASGLDIDIQPGAPEYLLQLVEESYTEDSQWAHFRGLMLGGRVHYTGEQRKELSIDALTGAVIFALTGSVSASTAVALFRRAARTFSYLSKEEQDLLIVISSLTRRSDSQDGVDHDLIVRAFDGRTSEIGVLLNRLLVRGVVSLDGRRWRIVD